MAKNTNPRYTIVGDVGADATATSSTVMGASLVTATGDFTGASANHGLVFTADATNGSRLLGVHFEPTGSNTASVARIYTNNGGANTTAAKNAYVGSVTLPTTTTSNTAAFGGVDYFFPGGSIDLPPGFRIYAGLGTTVSTSWIATPILGGKF
jgi:hypothetical protein